MAEAVYFVFRVFDVYDGLEIPDALTASPEAFLEATVMPKPRSVMFRRLHNEPLTSYDLARDTFEGHWRSVQNTLRLKNFPTSATIEELVKICIEAKQRQTGIMTLTPEDQAHIASATRFLHEYRAHLEKNATRPGLALKPPAFWARSIAETRTPIPSMAAFAQFPIGYEEVIKYITASVEYLRRYSERCSTTSPHAYAFELFKRYMTNLQRRAEKQHANGSDNSAERFAILCAEIRSASFDTEVKLLEASLMMGLAGPTWAYFSDCGFADSKGRCAVWCEDEQRRRLVWVARQAREASPAVVLRRTLLLDDLTPSAYTEPQRRLLARDITYLLDNGVDVSVALRDHAQEVDPLYNFALVSDGTIMRAGATHTEWRIGKVATSNKEFKRLNRAYLEIEDQAVARWSARNVQLKSSWRGYCDESVDYITNELVELLSKVPTQKARGGGRE